MKRTPLEISTEERVRTYLFALGAGCKKRGQDGEGDIEIFWGKGRCMWMEFKKADTGHKRAGQKVWNKYMTASGYEAHFVDTFEQAVGIIEMWRVCYGEPSADRDAAFNPK